MRSVFSHAATVIACRWFLFVGCLLWLFYPGLVHSQIPAFRDAYHFYYPQAVWLDRCAEQGDYFPRWNPTEGLGVSVAGQPSAALYYPLRLLWWLPGLNVAQRFSLVILVHLVIAAWGIHFAARKLGASDRAAWLGAVSYALSCPVFFQHSNLIFLCSAAWIGFALGTVIDALRSSTVANLQPGTEGPHRYKFARSCAWFATATTLMLLAGDPQTAVNAFIAAGLIFVSQFTLQLCSKRSVAGMKEAADPRCAGVEHSQPSMLIAKPSHALWIATAACLLVVLGFVQWLPAWRWANHSGRAQNTSKLSHPPASTPHHVPVTSDAIAPAVAAALRETPSPPHHRYDFSLSPWHLITCLWPTAGGHYLPNNSRWFAAIPAEGRMWIPSLYFGCWPCLFVLLAVIGRRHHHARLLVILAGFALLASFGNYSVLWLLREVITSLGFDALATRLPPDHVGSLVSLLNAFIPGYDMFRYPAKWSVWFVAATSLFASLQFDRYLQSASQSLPRTPLRIVLLLSGAGFLVSLLLWLPAANGQWLDSWLVSRVNDPWFGAPQHRAVAVTIAIATAVPLLVIGIIARRSIASGRLPAAIALVTLVEMTWCASYWVDFVPPPTVEFDALPLSAASEPFGLHGVARHNSQPPFVWSNRSWVDIAGDHFLGSPADFIVDQTRYQQVWLLGKLGLTAPLRCLHAVQSIEPIEMAQLRSWLSRHDNLSDDQPDVDRVLRELGVTHRLVREQFDHQPSQFSWREIADPQPMCQWSLEGRSEPDSSSTLTWEWQSASQLSLHIATPQTSMLLVRQTNDGGWIAHNERGKRLAINQHSLFIEIPLSAEVTQVSLSRKWLW